MSCDGGWERRKIYVKVALAPVLIALPAINSRVIKNLSLKLLYRTVNENFAAWLELASVDQFGGQGDHRTPSASFRQAIRKHHECGICAHGFARARSDDCGHECFVAFSRKCWVFVSCNRAQERPKLICVRQSLRLVNIQRKAGVELRFLPNAVIRPTLAKVARCYY
ncbi:MAG: hypothetical protein IPN53_03205 [Comamonadaceae bacterium]|nr:hypothetical protein [Comamonadaceae bacterium]